ncbi:hypothetical protein LCGC14_0846770 [marine sediment metagenome]|uniref:Uncharacterized protein n=1 Tax=marine sediment metagenome TaxID=412755 RepID=A0A0F9RWA8_9ZZZZ
MLEHLNSYFRYTSNTDGVIWVQEWKSGCWCTYWKDAVLRGWWVQHGANPEACRFFSATLLTGPGHPFSEMVLWVNEAHDYSPCEPKPKVDINVSDL